ncbi:MAG TPA: hypothetical protein VN844_29555, partial [Pyrinomonadaceae bacterium]|nr:hypothetical protein [Pyrinomonadaceae bacterium]
IKVPKQWQRDQKQRWGSHNFDGQINAWNLFYSDLLRIDNEHGDGKAEGQHRTNKEFRCIVLKELGPKRTCDEETNQQKKRTDCDNYD